MKVAAVEHYPGKPPDQPGVQVVIRLEIPGVTMGDVRALGGHRLDRGVTYQVI